MYFKQIKGIPHQVVVTYRKKYIHQSNDITFGNNSVRTETFIALFGIDTVINEKIVVFLNRGSRRLSVIIPLNIVKNYFRIDDKCNDNIETLQCWFNNICDVGINNYGNFELV